MQYGHSPYLYAEPTLHNFHTDPRIQIQWKGPWSKFHANRKHHMPYSRDPQLMVLEDQELLFFHPYFTWVSGVMSGQLVAVITRTKNKIRAGFGFEGQS